MHEFIISASVDQHGIKLATGVLEPLPGQKQAFTHTWGALKSPIKPFYLVGGNCSKTERLYKHAKSEPFCCDGPLHH